MKDKLKKTKERNTTGFLYYLVPKNLISEIQQYGYVYSMKKMFLFYGLIVLVAVGVGILYRIPMTGIAGIVLASIISSPILIRNSFHSAYEQQRFSDANRYISKMLYYFKSSRKIITSLQDIKSVFPDGMMHECIEKAIDHIMNSGSYDAMEEALQIIEEKFSCSRIHTVNQFLLRMEERGGDCETEIDLLLEDRKLWAERTAQMQRKKSLTRTNILISVAVSTGLCLFVQYVPKMLPDNMKLSDISQIGFVWVSSVLFLICEILIFIRADKKLCINWLEDAYETDEKTANEDYRRVVNFKPSIEFKKSLILAIFPAVITFFLLMLTQKQNIYVLALGTFLTVLMLNQHRFNHKLKVKRVTKEIREAFPLWLMDLSLLLQTENVPMSLAHSAENAPNILKPALRELLEELDKDRISELPYQNFLSYFALSEVSDTMSSLYSVFTGAGGNTKKELKEIIQGNISMMDELEKFKGKDKVALMRTMVYTPSLLGAMKLMIDMSALLIAFLQIDVI